MPSCGVRLKWGTVLDFHGQTTGEKNKITKKTPQKRESLCSPDRPLGFFFLKKNSQLSPVFF